MQTTWAVPLRCSAAYSLLTTTVGKIEINSVLDASRHVALDPVTTWEARDAQPDQ